MSPDSLSNSENREVVVQRDLASVVHPLVQHKVLEQQQLVVVDAKGSTIISTD